MKRRRCCTVRGPRWLCAGRGPEPCTDSFAGEEEGWEDGICWCGHTGACHERPAAVRARIRERRDYEARLKRAATEGHDALVGFFRGCTGVVDLDSGTLTMHHKRGLMAAE
jgi:hypothetical protein